MGSTDRTGQRPTHEQPGEPSSRTRKAYRAPALREYGPLRDLTAGGSGVMSEFPDMNMNRFP